MIVQFERGLQSATLQLASVERHNSSQVGLVTLKLSYFISAPSIRLQMAVIPPGHEGNNGYQPSQILFDSDHTANEERENYNLACGTFTTSHLGVYRVVLIAEKIRFTFSPAYVEFSKFVVSNEACPISADVVTSGSLPTGELMPKSSPMNHYISAIYNQTAGRN